MNSPTPQHFAGLLERARQGSAEALGLLLDQYRPFLLRLANDEIEPDMQAKVGGSDLVQQSFLEASAAFAQFHGYDPEEWKDWLARILRNNARDLRRQFQQSEKRAVHREVGPGDYSNSYQLPLPADGGSSPSEHLLRQERVEALQAAIQRLSSHQQNLIRLRQQEGLTFLEIGRRLGCTEEAARKQWARAIEELRDLLRGAYGSSAS